MICFHIKIEHIYVIVQNLNSIICLISEDFF